ncbi:DUF21-domain-containing protein [Dentipellis sp. KUC8613]|nr:DUF21-domain-containing protein [Dentipellis sp. KUC8613]
MVPPPLRSSISSSSRPLLLSLAASLSHHVPSFSRAEASGLHTLAKRESEKHDTKFIIFALLIPILVLLSGVFAGLTLGYMSLDETQLQVLSISGTPEQRKYAEKIKPIRKNGHLLLVTLLLANMITNETLPVISDPVLGGGVQSVVVSTVLIVTFAEIIPQSICTRYGLYIGAKMAPFVRVLIWTLGIVSWPIAKLLEFMLGPHHGIIYRRAELKELIAMHSSVGGQGDLRSDTVTIIGATLDLQEKTARQAMTKIEDVFMLSIDAKLDYETLKKVCLTGHSRIPVYEDVDLPDGSGKTFKAKKILGILLVKQCVLLDPNEAVPVRRIPLNKVPSLAQNEPLLGILDRFQEGRSHMAIVSRMSIEKATSVKKAVKKGIAQRLKDRVGISDSSSSSDEEEEQPSRLKFRRKRTKSSDRESNTASPTASAGSVDETLGDGITERDFADEGSRHFSFRKKRKNHKKRATDVEMGNMSADTEHEPERNSIGKAPEDDSKVPAVEFADVSPAGEQQAQKTKKGSFVQLPKLASGFEQSMPADAVLGKEGAHEFLMGFDPAVAPLGIITLEDVLEELIGEEIYDEFDSQGPGEVSSYVPPQHIKTAASSSSTHGLKHKLSAPQLSANVSDSSTPVTVPIPTAPAPVKSLGGTPVLRPIALKGLNFLTSRSRSAPPTPRDAVPVVSVKEKDNANAKLNVDLAVDSEKPSVVGDSEKAAIAGYTVTSNPDIVVTASSPLSAPPDDASNPTPTPTNNPTSVPAPHPIRSASPAPSLDALFRTRRPSQPTGPGGSISRAPTPGGSGPRGRFKSSPLSGWGEGPVVVAERVRGRGDEERIVEGEVKGEGGEQGEGGESG